MIPSPIPHVFRIAHRTGLSYGKTPLQVETHGRNIGTARNPKCGACPINDLCEKRI